MNAKPSTGIGDVTVDLDEYGGAFDGSGNLVRLAVELNISCEEAYRFAGELVTAANAVRERNIAAAVAERDERIANPSRLSIAAAIDNVATANARPGPFVIVPARKLSPEEKAKRDASKGTP